MSDLTLEFISAETTLFQGQVRSVSVETLDGEIGFLYGHEPFLGELKPDGVTVVNLTDGTKKVAAINGGFVSVSKDKVILLANSAVWVDDILPHELELSATESQENLSENLVIRGKMRAKQRSSIAR